MTEFLPFVWRRQDAKGSFILVDTTINSIDAIISEKYRSLPNCQLKFTPLSLPNQARKHTPVRFLYNAQNDLKHHHDQRPYCNT